MRTDTIGLSNPAIDVPSSRLAKHGEIGPNSLPLKFPPILYVILTESIV